MKIRDIGCDDFVGAARNRRMIANKENIKWWLWMEAVRDSCPYGKPLPWWIPQGGLPRVGKYEARSLYQHGIYQIEEEF